METINLIVTIVSIVFTIISIWFSIQAIRAATEAKNVKKQVETILTAISLKEFVQSYNFAKQTFLKETRGRDWFKGKETNLVITPFDDVLSKFSTISPILNDADLKYKIHTIKLNIQNYDKLPLNQKREVINLMEVVAERLGELLSSQVHNC